VCAGPGLLGSGAHARRLAARAARVGTRAADLPVLG
jgi:hypothetical protein